MDHYFEVSAAANIQQQRPGYAGSRRRCGIAFSKEPVIVRNPPNAVLKDGFLRKEEVSAEDVARRGAVPLTFERPYYTLAELGFLSGPLSKATGDQLAMVATALDVVVDEDPLSDFEAELRAAVLDEAMTGPLDTVRRAGLLLNFPLDALAAAPRARLDDATAVLGVEWEGKKKPSDEEIRAAILSGLLSTDLEVVRIVAEIFTAQDDG